MGCGTQTTGAAESGDPPGLFETRCVAPEAARTRGGSVTAQIPELRFIEIHAVAKKNRR